MAQGKISGSNRTIFRLFLLCILLHGEFVESAKYSVGKDTGWDSAHKDWNEGKSFEANDVLVFKYDRLQHNAVEVAEKGFNVCKVHKYAKLHNSGDNHIRLVNGTTYFIGGRKVRCDAGQKTIVTTIS